MTVMCILISEDRYWCCVFGMIMFVGNEKGKL